MSQVGISALREDEISIVQSSMIGSILSSILLVSEKKKDIRAT